MLSLIKAEIYVLYKTKTFRILCIIVLLLTLIFSGAATYMTSEKSEINQGIAQYTKDKEIENTQNKNGESMDTSNTDNDTAFSISGDIVFSATLKEMFYTSFSLGILMAILVGSLLAIDYNSGTLKNILAYGKKRENYYISKLVAVTIGFSIILGIMVIIGPIVCCYRFEWGEPFTFDESLRIVKVFAGAIVVGMAIISLLMFISTLLKNKGLTLGIGIIIIFVMSSMCKILAENYELFDKINKYLLPYNWKLITTISSENSDILKAITVGLITIIITTISGITIFKKQDII